MSHDWWHGPPSHEATGDEPGGGLRGRNSPGLNAAGTNGTGPADEKGIGCRPGIYSRRDRAGTAHAWAWQAATLARVAYNSNPRDEGVPAPNSLSPTA